MKKQFDRFPDDSLQFLRELAANNSREWFESRKARYEQSVRDPALGFIAAMSGPLAEIAPTFTAVPKKTGGSLMRPYRDVRFSTDKTPYKTNIGIQFRHERGKDAHAPGFYVHLEPGACFVGVGLWRPDKVPLGEIRQAIADSPEEYRSIVTAGEFAERYTLGGEVLKKPPKGFDPDHPLIQEIKRKDFIASHDVSDSQAVSTLFFDEVVESFRIAVPYVRFLCDALGLSF
jgi:uncharacterized protein (TIGR02453 family)